MIVQDERINALLTEIHNEEKARRFGYKLALKGKIYELISYLLRNYVVEKQSPAANLRRMRNLDRLNTVIQYIQDNYQETISIKQLADLIHLSEYHFCHIFKESIGQSPLKYINEVRLKKAYNLLMQKDMTIAEIAARVGFQDYNNFSRLFSKYYGFPPSKVWNSKGLT